MTDDDGSGVVSPRRLQRLEWDAGELLRKYPPTPRNGNKKILFGLSCPDGATHSGRVIFTRWAKAPSLPSVRRARGMACEVVRGAFQYSEEGCMSWHLNFADRKVFGFYEGTLFAQDEIQVCEHPSLASVRHAVQAVTGSAPLTTERGEPTPVLVCGAERRISVDSAGVYGRAFKTASGERVRSATRVLDRPTTSNVIAIEAPKYGHGRYTVAQLRKAVETAYTGFRAAVVMSEGRETAVHTGAWGCGVFGGNRVAMGAVQVLAAKAAGVGRLAYHALDDAAEGDWRRSLGVVESLFGGEDEATAEDLLQRLESQGFTWGKTDGN